MKKERLLTIAVIALLLINLGTLGFLFLQRPPHPRAGGPDKFGRNIEETLQLNDTQQQQFQEMKTAHHSKMDSLNVAYRDVLGNYFALLKNDHFMPAQRDSLQAILSQIQNDRASITFQHFAELKALCTQEQQQRFNALVPDLMQVILPRREPDGPPGKRERR